MLKRFHEDCTRVEVPNRRQHDARRTFISLARASGANADALKAVTHGRSQEILDLYTTMPWPTLCDAVRCLKVAFPLEAKHPSLPNRNGEPKSVGERDVEVVPAGEQQGACYALVTATEGNGEDHEKSQKAAALLASQDWRGVRDSNFRDAA